MTTRIGRDQWRHHAGRRSHLVEFRQALFFCLHVSLISFFLKIVLKSYCTMEAVICLYEVWYNRYQGVLSECMWWILRTAWWIPLENSRCFFSICMSSAVEIWWITPGVAVNREAEDYSHLISAVDRSVIWGWAAGAHVAGAAVWGSALLLPLCAALPGQTRVVLIGQRRHSALLWSILDYCVTSFYLYMA